MKRVGLSPAFNVYETDNKIERPIQNAHFNPFVGITIVFVKISCYGRLHNHQDDQFYTKVEIHQLKEMPNHLNKERGRFEVIFRMHSGVVTVGDETEALNTFWEAIEVAKSKAKNNFFNSHSIKKCEFSRSSSRIFDTKPNYPSGPIKRVLHSK